MYRHLQGKEVPYKKSCALGRKVKLVADNRERIKQRASGMSAGNAIFLILRGGWFMKKASVSDLWKQHFRMITNPDPDPGF